MKHLHRTIVAILLTGILMASCEEIKFVEINDYNKKLVLNGILEPDLGLWVNVTESVSATTRFANSFKPVEDALVCIYYSDSMVTYITENDRGNYLTTGFHPLEGETYRIEVTAGGLPTVASTVSIPQMVEIVDYEFTTIEMPDHYGEDYYNEGEVIFFTRITFIDPPEEGNHYMLGAYYLEEERYIPLQLDIEDMDVNVYILDGIGVVACNDQNFNGNEKELTATFRMSKPDGFNTVILLTLYSIEKSFFDYLKSYSQNFTVLNEDMILFEPVEVSTNIREGFGIISGVTSSAVTFEYEF